MIFTLSLVTILKEIIHAFLFVIKSFFGQAPVPVILATWETEIRRISRPVQANS
jgi:hypothetical protein